jgi:hypothetical protein
MKNEKIRGASMKNGQTRHYFSLKLKWGLILFQQRKIVPRLGKFTLDIGYKNISGTITAARGSRPL